MNDGIMVAVHVPPHVVSELPGNIEDPHITLAFLGRISEVPADRLRRIEPAVRRAVVGQAPVQVALRGTGTFPITENSEGKVPFYARVESPSLRALRGRIVSSLTRARVPYATNFAYKPHMTLAYLEPGAPLPAIDVMQAFSVDRVGVSIGTSRVFVPFSAMESLSEKLS